MPKIEIIDKVYFCESIKILGFILFCIFIGFFIGKRWYKNIIYIFRRKK